MRRFVDDNEFMWMRLIWDHHYFWLQEKESVDYTNNIQETNESRLSKRKTADSRDGDSHLIFFAK